MREGASHIAPRPPPKLTSSFNHTKKVTGSVSEGDLWFVTNPNAKAYMLQRLPVYRRVDFALQVRS